MPFQGTSRLTVSCRAVEQTIDAAALAAEIDRRIVALANPTTETIRRVRRAYSKRLHTADAGDVVAVADALVERHRWVAYELLYHHPDALSVLGSEEVTRLGRGLDSWGSVDAFGRYISGPAWQRGVIPDEIVLRSAASPDRWWRRAALVSTVPLNLRSAGGSGDAERTLEVCRRLASDRDDMVVKALSWALRGLVRWDPSAVRGFLEDQGDVLATQVRREVLTKLETGRKVRARPSVDGLGVDGVGHAALAADARVHSGAQATGRRRADTGLQPGQRQPIGT